LRFEVYGLWFFLCSLMINIRLPEFQGKQQTTNNKLQTS
jgi:hypothetical protein